VGGAQRGKRREGRSYGDLNNPRWWWLRMGRLRCKRPAKYIYRRAILDKIKAWLDAKAPKVLPKGLLGQAIAIPTGCGRS